MKKTLIIIATALLAQVVACNTLRAQGNFDAYVTAGLNMAQIDGDGAGKYNHGGVRAGVGTSFSLGVGDAWRGVMELAYTQKGSYIGEYDRRLSADYVEVVAMVSYNCLDNRLRLAAGVAPGVLVRAKVTNSGSDDQPSADNFSRVDRLPLTAAVRYSLGKHLALELRWQNSMLGVTKEAGSGTYRIFRSNKGVFHRLLTFGAAWQF